MKNENKLNAYRFLLITLVLIDLSAIMYVGRETIGFRDKKHRDQRVITRQTDLAVLALSYLDYDEFSFAPIAVQTREISHGVYCVEVLKKRNDTGQYNDLLIKIKQDDNGNIIIQKRTDELMRSSPSREFFCGKFIMSSVIFLNSNGLLPSNFIIEGVVTEIDEVLVVFTTEQLALGGHVGVIMSSESMFIVHGK